MDLKSVIDTRRRGEPDLGFFITVLILAGLGVAMCYSASAVFAAKTFGDFGDTSTLADPAVVDDLVANRKKLG